jgi:hypothetical protein
MSGLLDAPRYVATHRGDVGQSAVLLTSIAGRFMPWLRRLSGRGRAATTRASPAMTSESEADAGAMRRHEAPTRAASDREPGADVSGAEVRLAVDREELVTALVGPGGPRRCCERDCDTNDQAMFLHDAGTNPARRRSARGERVGTLSRDKCGSLGWCGCSL